MASFKQFVLATVRDAQVRWATKCVVIGMAIFAFLATVLTACTTYPSFGKAVLALVGALAVLLLAFLLGATVQGIAKA
jgi:hypothetical protein